MLQYMLVLVPAMLNDRRGVSSLEYAILALGVIGAVSAATAVLASGLSEIFQDIVTELLAKGNG